MPTDVLEQRAEEKDSLVSVDSESGVKIMCFYQFLGTHEGCSRNLEQNPKCPFGYQPIKVHGFYVND